MRFLLLKSANNAPAMTNANNTPRLVAMPIIFLVSSLSPARFIILVLVALELGEMVELGVMFTVVGETVSRAHDAFARSPLLVITLALSRANGSPLAQAIPEEFRTIELAQYKAVSPSKLKSGSEHPLLRALVTTRVGC